MKLKLIITVLAAAAGAAFAQVQPPAAGPQAHKQQPAYDGHKRPALPAERAAAAAPAIKRGTVASGPEEEEPTQVRTAPRPQGAINAAPALQARPLTPQAPLATPPRRERADTHIK